MAASGPKKSFAEVETLEPARPAPAAGARPRPFLTVLLHPDPDRVGDWCALFTDGRERVALSRLEPAFQSQAGLPGAPLQSPFLGRTPHWLSPSGRGGVRLVTDDQASALLADGAPLAATRAFSAEALDEGVVLTLSERVVLLLHLRAAPPAASDDPSGLVGASPAIEDLRAAIARLAPADGPVLLRGESGAGKELAAQALHAASPRATGPLSCINLAAIPASTAASELFGHVAGAFTGATRAHRGYFEQADGGTLLLDEIGAAPAEIQAMLLRVLESGEIQPVGGGLPRRVDVRVLAATDEDLEQAMAAGRFRAPLYHRLSAHHLTVPPLRARREDLGRLLVHLLRRELSACGREDKLHPPAGRQPGWLGADLVSALARHDWPGNVRQLHNAVRHMVTHFADAERVDTDAILDLLQREAAPADPAPARKPPAEIADAELLAALRAHRFQIKPTAAALGISRTSLYALMEKCPHLRQAKDIPDAELRACQRACAGDVQAMAAKLQVSVQALRLRLRDLSS